MVVAVPGEPDMTGVGVPDADGTDGPSPEALGTRCQRGQAPRPPAQAVAHDLRERA